MAADDENHFEYALGFAVVRRWADLSRETQQLLFDEATAGDDSLRDHSQPSCMGSIPKPASKAVALMSTWHAAGGTNSLFQPLFQAFHPAKN